jgi:hypothetical protein
MKAASERRAGLFRPVAVARYEPIVLLVLAVALALGL